MKLCMVRCESGPARVPRSTLRTSLVTRRHGISMVEQFGVGLCGVRVRDEHETPTESYETKHKYFLVVRPFFLFLVVAPFLSFFGCGALFFFWLWRLFFLNCGAPFLFFFWLWRSLFFFWVVAPLSPFFGCGAPLFLVVAPPPFVVVAPPPFFWLWRPFFFSLKVRFPKNQVCVFSFLVLLFSF